jgi:hypothetical protein
MTPARVNRKRTKWNRVAQRVMAFGMCLILFVVPCAHSLGHAFGSVHSSHVAAADNDDAGQDPRNSDIVHCHNCAQMMLFAAMPQPLLERRHNVMLTQSVKITCVFCQNSVPPPPKAGSFGSTV